MKSRSGFTLIEIIVAMAIIAILAGAMVPVYFKQLDQTRFTRMKQDMQTIYEAAMGVPSENYFGYVGDVGELPDSVGELIDSAGQGTTWNGPYLSVSGAFNASDVYGSNYVFDSIPIRVRSYGPDKTNNSGVGDDLYYPENALSTYSGQLEVQVYVNGRLITNAAAELITADLSYANNGSLASVSLTFSTSTMSFTLPSPVHQGSHVITVVAAKAVQDPATTLKEQVIIRPGATTKVQVSLEDADYMTRTDTDLNGNGVPDRLEDMDGDGVPDDMDPDIDGDGTPNAIDPDPLDPTITGGGGGEVAPVVNNVTPSYGNQGATNLLLTIDGTYFDNGATVSISGTGVTVLTVPATYVGATQLTVSVNISGSAPTGLRNVTVTNPSGLSGTGNNKFQVLAAGAQPAPIISQVVPNQAQQGATGLLISIQGQNFVSGSVVTFSNPGISIASSQFISSGELRRTINVSGSASVGVGKVRVTNPDNQWVEANFEVIAVVPNISQLVPNQGNSNQQNLWVTVSGSNFLSGAQASTSAGAPFSIDQVAWDSPTQMRVRVDCGFSFYGADGQIIITNPGGGTASANFHVKGLFE